MGVEINGILYVYASGFDKGTQMIERFPSSC
jgi:hypothetical protein